MLRGNMNGLTRECNHDPLVENERDKPVLDKDSKALEGQRRVVIDPRFLNSLHQYVTFKYASFTK